MSASDLFCPQASMNHDEIKKFKYLRNAFLTADNDHNYLLNKNEFNDFVKILYHKPYIGLYENWCKHFRCNGSDGIDFISLRLACIQTFIPIQSWSPMFYAKVPQKYICKACNKQNDHWIMCCKLIWKFKQKQKEKQQQKLNDNLNKYYDEREITFLISGYMRKLAITLIILHKLPKSLIYLIYNYYPRIFRFSENNKGCYINPKNRLIISADKYITAQFGDFFSNKINCIYKVKFNMKTAVPGYSGIGFITNKFEEYTRWEWNEGYNDSMVLHGNGYFISSRCFDIKMKNYKKHIFGETDDGKKINWYEMGHDVMVKIDTVKMIGIIWNYTMLQMDDMNETYFDNFCEITACKPYAFITKLPFNKYEIAITVEMGGWTVQEMAVKHQEWMFKSQHSS